MSPADVIDLTCDEFESQLQRGERPRIESYLDRCPEEHQSKLLFELLSIETEVALKRGHVVYLDEYALRYRPQQVVFEAFASFLWEGARGRCDSSTITFDGLRLNQFRLLAIIGHGGFGTVWLAQDLILNRNVAIKTPHVHDDHNAWERSALHEAVAAAGLRHPNIVPVFEVGESDGRWFLVTPYIGGGNLAQLLASGDLSLDQALALAIQLALGLRHAHQHEILHRDLKPSNILVSESGDPLIADFGLAGPKGAEEYYSFCGTRAYMSPEQLSQRPADARSDIYSLGLVIRDLLEACRSKDRSLADREKRYVLDRIREKCTQSDPDLRYARSSDLVEDVQRLKARRPPRHLRLGRLRAIRSYASLQTKWVAAAVTAAAVLGAFGLMNTDSPPPGARRVLIQTEPPGCDITFVAIDEATGEPDPRRITKAPGASPVESLLTPGDYLIVASLDDERFHEVQRHIPSHSESLPFSGPHRHWTQRDEIVELATITIPAPIAEFSLIPVEQIGELRVANPNAPAGHAQRITVPGFLAASRETRSLRADERLLQTHAPRDLLIDFHHAMKFAELAGMRLPSAAEMCVLLQQEAFRASAVMDLDDEMGEWTTSRPGAPGTALVPPLPHRDVRVLMGLSGTEFRSEQQLLIPRFDVRDERSTSELIGARFVKSRRPRTTPADFVQAENTFTDAPPATTPEKRRP